MPTPASHTLIVPSRSKMIPSDPETMVLPSVEKATDITGLLCALCFSALSSRDAAAGRGAVSFGLRFRAIDADAPASHQTLIGSRVQMRTCCAVLLAQASCDFVPPVVRAHVAQPLDLYLTVIILLHP